jgi:hypothetical protein
MSVSRLFSLPTHALLEFLGGLALLVAPFALGLGAAATVVAVALGIVLAGVGLAATADLSISTHMVLDQGLALALLAAAVALAFAGDRAGALLLLVVGAAQAGLILTTRYSRPLRP